MGLSMDVLRKQLPFAMGDWTVNRFLVFVGKLALFIYVPGLHQMSCQRWIFGSLLFVMYVFSWFAFSHQYIDVLSNPPLMNFPYFVFWETVQIVSWGLLILDAKNLGKRKFQPSFLFVLLVMGIASYIPRHEPGIIFMFVESGNKACPEFCENEIVEFQRLRHDPNISAGDNVVLIDTRDRHYVDRVWAGPSEEVCPLGIPESLNLPAKNNFCYEISDDPDPFLRYMYRFMILGGPEPDFKTTDGREVSLIGAGEIQARKVERIGNLHEYYFVNEKITEIIGNSLITIYKWTGLNLFGLSGKF
jgi:hypothetical protein